MKRGISFFTALGGIIRRSRAGWLVGLAGLPLMASAAVLKGPYVMLEDAKTLSIRLEVDRPEGEVVLRLGNGGRMRCTPDFLRGPRNTFLGRVTIDLGAMGGFRGYEVWHDGQLVGDHSWRSRIDGTLDDYPRLVVVGDTQEGKETTARLAGRWEGEQFDLLVMLGDLVDNGSRYESWEEEFFGPLKDGLPGHALLVLPGNHDPYRERSFAWFDWYFGRTDGRRYFAIDFADLRLIGLNNSDVHTKYGIDPIDPLTPQAEFLQEALLAPDAAKHKAVILAHVPLFSGSSVVNREFGSELQRRYLQPLIERSRVLAFFAGHHHKYERLVRPGLRGDTQYFVTGGGGGRLFTADRARGGWVMDREVFEKHHYLLVDFRGDGDIAAKSIDGEELDRTSFRVAPKAVGPDSGWLIRPATLGEDSSVRETGAGAPALTLRADPAPVGPGRMSASLLRTEAGFVVLARNLHAVPRASRVFTLQGYDFRRQAWGYLQGASLAINLDQVRGKMAVVTLNGLDLAPFDRIFPVLHWPLAGARAGVTGQAGAVLLLRDDTGFDLMPAADRVVAGWRWGDLPRTGIAASQVQRQLTVLDGAAVPETIDGGVTAALLQSVREQARQCHVVQAGDGRIMATLVHWPASGFIAIAPGSTLAAGQGAIFLPVDEEVVLTVALKDGLSGLLVRADHRSDLFIPLAPLPGTGK